MKTKDPKGNPEERGTRRRRAGRARPLAALLCLILMLPAAAGGEAGESVLTVGAYEYVLRPGGDAEIVFYNGAEERIDVPSSLDGHPVTAIRAEAFSTDWKLEIVTIPSGVRDIEANPFADCRALTRIIVLADHPTLAVRDGALYDRRTDTLIAYPAGAASGNVSVAPGTKAIGDSAFASCPGLVSVDLPEGLVSIGDLAFRECGALTSVSLPDSLTGIGDYAFNFCSSLTDAVLPGRLTALGREAFSNCAALVSVTIPESLTRLECNPFTGCTALERIVLSADHPTLRLEDGVMYDGPAARLVWYPDSRTDTEFTVPAWVREIGACAFSSPFLTSVTLPGGMMRIGEDAFRCRNLVTVDLPDSLKEICDSAFFFCFRLSGADFPAGLRRIGEKAFYNCAFTALTLPEGLAEIGDEAFASCTSLKEVSFPSTLDRIGESAFYGCGSLTSVSLPEGLTRIGSQAFAWCGSLNAVTLPSSLVHVGEDAFFRCGKDLVFIVPPGGYAEDLCRARGYAYARADAPSVRVETDGPWLLTHPDLSEPFIGRDRMNLYVYWVQVRLKATGVWYQGDEWDCTGNLGSHTMAEIAAFVRAAAGCGHDGTVDQLVIDLLLDVPDAPGIPVGGFYDRLDSLTGGDRFGDMARVDRSSPRDAVIWVQTCLKRLGFYTSSVDGVFGSGTLRALHAFQKKYGWAERDYVSYGLARDLLERYVASGGDPDELP